MQKAILIGVILVAIAGAAYSIYRSGYNAADAKHTLRIQELEREVKALAAREAVIEKEIVTVYKDRVVRVKQIEEKIVEVTRDVLREESVNCTIGPNFISLHNAAASSKDISSGTSGVDGTSTAIETTSR